MVAAGTAAGVISAVAGEGERAGARPAITAPPTVAPLPGVPSARATPDPPASSAPAAPHPARSPAPPRVSFSAAVPSRGGLYRHHGCEGAAGTFSPDYAYRPATG
ncbi:hypothetical protein ACFV6Z_34245 [Streptomyces sp. NPDC059818]|uniref:hypothetical protein n=1 Tax=Streptomyces sp. NPDC059818 TaxID=3346962 RepID=UPI003666D6F0